MNLWITFGKQVTNTSILGLPIASPLYCSLARFYARGRATASEQI